MLLGIKKIFDKVEVTDGTRVLVDRLWPRGVKKSTAHIDKWIKDIAPSNDLRLWFTQNPSKWEEFRRKYLKELEKNEESESMIALADKTDITLVYASQDAEHNNAVVLSEFLGEKLKLKQKEEKPE